MIPDYFLILFRALTLTLAQSICSALFSAFLGVFFALIFALSSHKLSQVVVRWGILLGRILFTIPGTVSAFLFLSLIHLWGFNFLKMGFFSIVACHVLFSAGWVFAESLGAMNLKMAGTFKEQIESAVQMRMSFREQVFFGPLSSMIKREFFYYFYYLFFIYLNAFSTVLILGGGPSYSTLDVVNYFSFQQDGLGLRLFIGVGIQLFLGVVLSFTYEKKLSSHRRTIVDSGISRSVEPFQVLGLRMPRFIFVLGSMLFFLYGLLFLVLVLSLLKISVFSLETSYLKSEVFLALVSTLKFVGSSLVWFCVFVASLIVLNVRVVEKKSRFFLAVSPFVFAFFLVFALDFLGLKETNSYSLAGLGLVLGWIPWIAYVLESQLSRIPLEQIEAARVFGHTRVAIFFKIKAHYFKSAVYSLGFFLASVAVADVLVSGIFIPQEETLSALARRWAQRYEFSGMSLVVTVQMVFVLILGIFEIKSQQKTRVYGS